MLGAVTVAAGRLRALVLWLVAVVRAVLRRACCCFRRRRRSSADLDLPLTAVGVVPNHLSPEEATQQGWESWGREEDPVTRQIREYRTALALARQQHAQQDQDPQEQQDFFQDMTPRIKRAPRAVVQGETDTTVTSGTSHLLAAQPLPIAGSDLGAWVEEEGWEAEEGDWQEEVREQRRLQRQRRAQEMQVRRSEQHRSGLGARLS